MADDAIFSLPFKEAEAFFKAKLNIPTSRWDDIWQGEHARHFMTAGAMKANLLSDFRDAVEKSVAGKMTLKEFQSRFDELVSKHGWSYNGGRNWRSALIYDTNVTTAYQAGRWKQFVESGVKYLMYVHQDGVMNPRPLHVALDGTVRPIDDAFWDVHFPPNGWKCHCRAVRADASEATGLPDAANDPATVDPGWRYNVGRAGIEQGYDALTAKLEKMPYDIAKQWTHEILQQPAFEMFIQGKINTNFPVAILAPDDRAVLGAETQTVWLSPQSRDEHLKGHPEIGIEDYRKIQNILDEGEVYVKPRKQGETGERLSYIKLDERMYIAGVKTTDGKGENFFLTLHAPTGGEKRVAVIRKRKRVR